MERVLTLLQQSDRPRSTNEIADELDIDWHTAKKRLDKLVEQEKVHRSRVSDRLTLYWDEEIPF